MPEGWEKEIPVGKDWATTTTAKATEEWATTTAKAAEEAWATTKEDFEDFSSEDMAWMGLSPQCQDSFDLGWGQEQP